ncbi:hypothetical protein H0X06_05135 [Candidatus Dependentiae bacterium]|nr:hypothetical protein [Candidatus Dependentiae bacterium]
MLLSITKFINAFGTGTSHHRTKVSFKKAVLLKIIVSVAVLTASDFSLKAMEKHQEIVKKAVLFYDLGNNNTVALHDPSLDKILKKMKVGKGGGRYPINNRNVLVPTNSALIKILSNSCNALTEDEIKGLLICVSAVMKENPETALTGKFEENRNVQWLNSTIMGFSIGKTVPDTCIDFAQLQLAYQLLKKHFSATLDSEL